MNKKVYKKVKSFIERTNTPFMLSSQISINKKKKKKNFDFIILKQQYSKDYTVTSPTANRKMKKNK